VDAHSPHLSDALPKLRGLARYAETHETILRRIDAVAKVGDKLRVLDLTDSNVRRPIDHLQCRQ